MRTSPVRSLSRQRGFGMLDAGFWLMIFIGVIVFIMDYGGFLTKQSQAVQNAAWHAQLVDRALAAYDPQNNCNGISASSLVQLNAVPQEFLQGGQIIDAWGGRVNVSAATTLVTDDTAIFTYPAVPAEECSSFTGSIEGNHFRVVVNGIAVKDTTANQQFSVTSLASACGGTANKRIDLYSRCR